RRVRAPDHAGAPDLAREIAEPRAGGRRRAGAARRGDEVGAHDGGWKTSLIGVPRGTMAPAAGSWRRTRPEPSTAGTRPAVATTWIASRAGRPARSGTRTSVALSGRLGAAGFASARAAPDAPSAARFFAPGSSFAAAAISRSCT